MSVRVVFFGEIKTGTGNWKYSEFCFVGDYFLGILRISFSYASNLQSIEESFIGELVPEHLVYGITWSRG
jgi:hypothetical protein